MYECTYTTAKLAEPENNNATQDTLYLIAKNGIVRVDTGAFKRA